LGETKRQELAAAKLQRKRESFARMAEAHRVRAAAGLMNRGTPETQPFLTVVGAWGHDRYGNQVRFVTGFARVEYVKRCEAAPVDSVNAAIIKQAIRDLAAADLERRKPKPPSAPPPARDDDEQPKRDGRKRKRQAAGDGGWTAKKIQRLRKALAA
jgi:hypothetical protein